jgi:hypothetical protein
MRETGKAEGPPPEGAGTSRGATNGRPADRDPKRQTGMMGFHDSTARPRDGRWRYFAA